MVTYGILRIALIGLVFAAIALILEKIFPNFTKFLKKHNQIIALGIFLLAVIVVIIFALI